jgi:glycosyltransferase involved in cell wall biosynthesis
MQSLKAFEIIVVDDASTDQTQKILETYGSDISFFKNSENKGVSFSRNLGVKKSSGDWIFFLDSDDQWLRNKLKLQFAAISKEPTSHLIHSNEKWFRNAKHLNQLKKHKKQGGDFFVRCLDLCLIGPSCAGIKKDFFEQLGGFREDFRVCEDYDLWLKATFLDRNILFIEEPLIIKHGGHDDQLSNTVGMDYWRILAIDDLLRTKPLTLIERRTAVEVLLQKAHVLINGLKKYENFHDLEKVQPIYDYWKDCQF